MLPGVRFAFMGKDAYYVHQLQNLIGPKIAAGFGNLSTSVSVLSFVLSNPTDNHTQLYVRCLHHYFCLGAEGFCSCTFYLRWLSV